MITINLESYSNEELKILDQGLHKAFISYTCPVDIECHKCSFYRVCSDIQTLMGLIDKEVEKRNE